MTPDPAAKPAKSSRPLHAKLDPQPPWARFEEVIVRLDTGELVSVYVENIADLTGGAAIQASARAVGEDGKPWLTAAGLPVATHLRRPYDMADLKSQGVRVVELQRDCVRVVLGEPTSRFFTDTAGQELRTKLSIRNKLRDATPSPAPARAPAAD